MPSNSNSKLNIAQQACIEAGGTRPVTSLDEGSAQAEAINQRYDAIVENEFSIYPWRWATTQAYASRKTAIPIVTVWSSAWELPQSLMNLRRVYVDNSPCRTYEKFGSDTLFLDNANDDSVVVVEGVFRPDEGEWEPFFTELCILALAVPIARHVVRDAQLADGLVKELEMQREIAHHSDSMQQPPRRMNASGMLARRY